MRGNLLEQFDLARGSFPGAEHIVSGTLFVGRNNQDSVHISASPDLIVACVTDGCGGGEHSELGSLLGARLLVGAVKRQWKRALGPVTADTFEARLQTILEEVRLDVVANLRAISHQLWEPDQDSERYSKFVENNLLFTIVGVLVTPIGAAFFSLGDGLIIVNDELIRIGPFPGNEPPYLAYGGLVGSGRWKSEDVRFTVHRCLPITELKSFLIGSDGAQDLLDREMSHLPGSDEPVGPLSQFWTEDRYFTRSGIRRRLTQINRRITRVQNGELNTEEPLLPDDTTLIVARRRKDGV